MSSVKRVAIMPVLLAAAGAAGAYYLLSVTRQGGTSIGDHLSAIVLALVAGSISAVSVLKFNRTMTAAASELSTMADSGELGHITVRDHNDSLQRVIKPINRLLSRCENDLKQANDHNRQLQIQARLSETEKHNYETVLNVSSDAILITDSFDEVRFANSAADKYFGANSDKSMHKPVSDYVKDSDLVEMIVQTRIKGSGDRPRTIEKTVDSGGDPQIFRYTLTRLQSESERSGGVITVIRDITRESEVAQMKNDFVSGVSHELRSPLAGIHAYIELLRDGEVEDEDTRKEFYDIIASQTDRLNRLIDNILNISRIEAGVVKVTPEVMDVTEVVKSIVGIATPQAAEKKIALTEKLAPVFGQVEADRDMISQAVMNLLSNAIKYTPDGGDVSISTQVDENAGVVKIAVSDSGIGIPPEDLPHLFEKFYRVEGSKNMAKGAGLGLNLVLNIVENLHGGRLTVSSEPGCGSVFTIELPVV